MKNNSYLCEVFGKKRGFAMLRQVIYICTTMIAALHLVACQQEAMPEKRPLPPLIDEEPEPEPDPESYTIMYYACGGGTLDNGLEIVLRSAELVECKEHINVTASVKWSSGRINKICGSDGGVYRLRLGSDTDGLAIENIGDKSYPIHTAENIADFILWSKSTSPADNYVLVLAGHGNGWHPGVGVELTRGTVRDTDLDRYISLEELNAALAISDTHFKLISFNSCLMNTLEYVTELADDTDYILAPSHVSVLLGSELSFLMTSLGEVEERGNEAFLKAMEAYMAETSQQMALYSDEESTLDVVLTETREIASLNKAIAMLTDNIEQLYEKEAEIGSEAMMAECGGTIANLETMVGNAYNFLEAHSHDEEITEMEYMRQSFTFDIVDIATRAATAIPTPELRSAADKVRTTAEAARRMYCVQGVDKRDIFYGVTLTNSREWAAKEYEVAGYCHTLFDKTTGWSRFLRRNNIALKY